MGVLGELLASWRSKKVFYMRGRERDGVNSRGAFALAQPVKKTRYPMKYETAESWHNLNARKLAKYDRQQRESDAQRTPWGGPSVQTMRANPRKNGEDLMSYVKRLKEVV